MVSFCRCQSSRAAFAGCSWSSCGPPLRPERCTSQGFLADSPSPRPFARCLAAARGQDWVVYAKPPLGGPEQVLTYLCRYTHRVAIANSRLVSITDDHVSFRWRDWRHPARRKLMRLSAGEFIRRFLLHTLPDGFHRIRYYGFFANRQRAAKLALCRQLLAQPAPPEPAGEDDDHPQGRTAQAVHLCPDCGGRMRPIAAFSRPFPCDTS